MTDSAMVRAEHLPFPETEYAQRLARTRAAMAGKNLDLLLVTSPPNLTWLSGYDSMWYGRNIPTALAITADRATFFDTDSHRGLVEVATANLDDVVWFRGLVGSFDMEPTHIAAIRDIMNGLRDRGMLKGSVGLDYWTFSPGKPVMDALEHTFRDAGLAVADASWLIEDIRLVKSPLEIEAHRRAAEIGDIGMQAIKDNLRPGLTEKDIEGIGHHAMARAGGEPAAIRTSVHTGPVRGWAHHLLPTENKVEMGHVVVIDFCASYKRYHADIERSFAVGDVDDRWGRTMEITARSIEEVVRQMRPGDGGERLREICWNHLRAHDVDKYVWFAGGYNLGIGVPPDWVGHAWWGSRGFRELVYVPGTVSNYENVLDIPPGTWLGGSCAGYIETLLMTDQGMEILSRFPRTLHVTNR